MTAHFKNNIMTVINDNGNALQYAKDGDKWRSLVTGRMVSYDDHLLLNRLLEMGFKAKREGRVRRIPTD